MPLAAWTIVVGAVTVGVTATLGTSIAPGPSPAPRPPAWGPPVPTSPVPAAAPGRWTATSDRAAPLPPEVLARPAPLARRFRWPLSPPPAVLRRFAVGPHPWSPGHRGVDLAAAVGQPVLAAGAGVVVFAGRVAGVGVVVVDHGGGLRTTYEPVAASVRVTATAAAGSRLGTLSTWPGHCAASCLHWGAIRAGSYVDPLALLGLEPPILLPLTAAASP